MKLGAIRSIESRMRSEIGSIGSEFRCDRPESELATYRDRSRAVASESTGRAENTAFRPGTARAMNGGMLVRALAVLAASGATALAAGCSAAPEPAPTSDEPIGSTSQGLSTADAISRAEQWVAAKLLYCQSANGKPDGDTACASVCTRESNAEWDPYRSDCSGFVSWAWDLPAPGRVTGEFAPYETDITTVIQASDLRPGDAANRNSGGHIVLFEKWTTVGSEAMFMEEPGCDSSTPYAHEFTSAVTLDGSNITIAYEGEAFTAIRYGALTTNQLPIGSLDSASCSDIVGWSQDGDSPTFSIAVALSFDTTATEADAGALATTANIDRSDLCTALGSCDHGFDVPMPSSMKDGKAHTVYAYGVDAQTGELSLLTSAPKTFTCSVPPVAVEDAGAHEAGASLGNGSTESNDPSGGGFTSTDGGSSSSSGGCATAPSGSSSGGGFALALAIASALLRRRR
jgi:MYXO-CTERM domain-containing protein